MDAYSYYEPEERATEDYLPDTLALKTMCDGCPECCGEEVVDDTTSDPRSGANKPNTNIITLFTALLTLCIATGFIVACSKLINRN